MNQYYFHFSFTQKNCSCYNYTQNLYTLCTLTDLSFGLILRQKNLQCVLLSNPKSAREHFEQFATVQNRVYPLTVTS